jgi:hypothetical protein
MSSMHGRSNKPSITEEGFYEARSVQLLSLIVKLRCLIIEARCSMTTEFQRVTSNIEARCSMTTEFQRVTSKNMCWLLGGYPKNSDDSPNTREKVLSTFRHKVRALRDGDSPSRLHKSQKI